MLEVQKYLKNNSLEDLEKEFNLLIKRYDDRIVLNYRIDSKPKYHPIILECRNLILSFPDYKVLSRSFDRFFNFGEGDDYINFNWDKSIIMNKLDGSLISLYFDGLQWNVSTKGTAFAESSTPLNETYYDLFLESIQPFNLVEFCRLLNTEATYIFELTSPKNRIVTRYTKTFITLLGVRIKESGNFINYNDLKDQLDIIFPLDISLPEMYYLNNSGEIIKFVESRTQMDEGVVCFDVITGKRIKIKNSAYVAIHHLRGNEVTTKSILTLLLKKEEDEYLSYFPEDYDLINKFKVKLEDLKHMVNVTYNTFKSVSDQKEFALKVKSLKYSGLVFTLRKGKTIDEIFNVNNLHVILKYFK